METLLKVTPISYRKIKNLQFTEFVFLYLDKNNKLKRAIPDVGQIIIESSDSLIEEALSADRVAPFELVFKYEETSSPVFNILVDHNGEVVRYSNQPGNNIELPNLLLDSKRRKNVSKLLKKLR